MGALIVFLLTHRLRREYSLMPQHLIVSSMHAPQALPKENIHNLPQEAFIRELRERYSGIPDQLLTEPELLELILPIIRDDLTVIESYSYQPQQPLACPISAFGGLDDKWVNESQINGWGNHTSANFTVSMFPGNHYYLGVVMPDLLATIRGILL